MRGLSSGDFALAERAGVAVRDLNQSATKLAPLEGMARQLLEAKGDSWEAKELFQLLDQFEKSAKTP